MVQPDTCGRRLNAHPGALALVLVLACAPSLAQAWSGVGRVRGTVRDAEDSPISGAKIVLARESDPSSGPPPVTSDARGRYAIGGLAPGVWWITIDARGSIRAQGRVVVPESGAISPVDVRLRSLEELTPTTSEGSRETVAEWILVGDSFLRDAHASEARAEYEKALEALPLRERASVLEAIARTWYLEGSHAQALVSLRSALRIDPGSERLRALLLAYAQSVGEESQARSYLEELAAGRPSVEEGSLAGSTSPEPTPPPPRALDEPVPHRPGRYRTHFSVRSPAGSLEECARRLGVSRAELAKDPARPLTYDPARESYEVYVPPAYAPGTPFGLLVWISPGPFGGTERSEIQSVLAERRLIWIGADDSGNARHRLDRIALALDAVEAMKRLYTLDPERIYVGGYSGGGRVASACALLYPELFQGGLFVRGVDYQRALAIPSSPGMVWPARFTPRSGSLARRARREHRFVLWTGTRDFNRALSRSVYEAMREDGFRNVRLLETPGAAHETPFDPTWLTAALAALDPATRKRSPPSPRRGA